MNFQIKPTENKIIRGENKIYVYKEKYYERKAGKLMIRECLSLVSGLLSVVVIGVLFSDMMHYVNKVNAADQAVKVCRINVSAAARNIREMALNPDTSSYDGYEQGVKTLLEEVDAKLKIIKKSGAVTCNRGCGKGFNRRKSAQHTGISFRGRDRKTGTQHAQVYPYPGILCR